MMMELQTLQMIIMYRRLVSKMRKSIRKTGRHICCFYIDNKMLFLLSVCAIGFMLFYYFSYDETELWRNACVLVEILFQLSLAIVANLIFFIFHVYLPSCKRTYRMRPIIIKKIKFMSILIFFPSYII